MKLHPIYYIFFIVLTCLVSCKKDNIQLYEGSDYIQFNRSYSDSSLFNFLAFPDKDEALAPLAVQLAGMPVDRDRSYKISVVKELSTATEDNYELPAAFTLKANKVTDTAWITLKKTPAISIKPVKLVLKIDDSDELNIGQTDHSVFILYVSNVLAKPDWWNDTVEDRFLGTYSDKKYQLFLQVTGQSDLDSDDENAVRYQTLRFKTYLLQEKDAGRTIYEENGSEMTVALIGG